MKKLVSILLLTFVFCIQLHCMEEREQPREEEAKEKSSLFYIIENAKEKDSLNSSSILEETKEQNLLTYIIEDKNNQAFEIDKFQVNQLKKAAKTIKFLLSNTKISPEDNVISLPNLDHTIIQNILALTTQVSTNPSKYNHTLSQQSLDNLITLFVAADYLDMPLLLDILSETITNKIIQELQPSWLQQIFQRDSTESQKTDQWLQKNKNTLDKIHSYLDHMLALKINNYINHHPRNQNNLTLSHALYLASVPLASAPYNIILGLSNPKNMTLAQALLKLKLLNQPIINNSYFKVPVIVKVLLKLFL